ncbi:hypothetical protein EVAR_81132_1 [Eumeta japonica]|uniref:Uncharacterized protein n=1 Tax=Eumeta variegata TaxID=151549 RepID=A0A4C1YUK8_EUMVA|nr:hypothetical protein EVAR_81132_1 [Eumeta japonica]
MVSIGSLAARQRHSSSAADALFEDHIALITQYHKTKWSTSLRSRHIVDLALSESDQSLRSPGPARNLASDPRSFVGASPSSSTSSPQFKRPKTVKFLAYKMKFYCGVKKSSLKMNHLNMYSVPDFNQPKNQAQADSEWGVDGCGRMHVGHQEIADGAGYQTSLRHFRLLRFNQRVLIMITFPDVHVSADEDMPSSSRTFRVITNSAFGS